MSVCLHVEAGRVGFCLVERDWRDDRIEELEALVARLMRRIEDLEARLAQFSGNSSRPPSSDPPGAPPPARPKRTGRKRGGQPGHRKQERALVPAEQVTQTHVLKPCACRRCGRGLAGDDPAPYRHQVVDLPKVTATVHE
jgi:transposase